MSKRIYSHTQESLPVIKEIREEGRLGKESIEAVTKHLQPFASFRTKLQDFFKNPLDKAAEIVYNTTILTLYQTKASKRKEKEHEKIFNTHTRAPHGIYHGSRLLGL